MENQNDLKVHATTDELQEYLANEEMLNSHGKYKPLVDAVTEFIEKVNSGKATSTDSYNKFKEALSGL